jgi:hypothetical protein
MRDLIEFVAYLLLYAMASVATCISFMISIPLGILVIGVLLGILGLDIKKEDTQQYI